MNAYERMARIIRHLDAHPDDQPSLSDLSDLAGLSEGHFHREFVSWVGVTPKDFCQHLALNRARLSLTKGESVLGASLEAGLSGPGRLHDLCVSLEAASPGEIKSGGHGIEFEWGVAESPFGQCFVATTARGLAKLWFTEDRDAKTALKELRDDWPEASFQRDDKAAGELVGRAFHKSPSNPQPARLRAWVRGTAFQVKVWQALLSIPEGGLSTYGRIAEAIGKPSACRAVGTAVGANPVAWLIPCHRVIRESGALGGYRWNLGRKRAMLAVEGAVCTTD